MKETKKLSKKLALGIIGIVLCAAIGSAVLLTYYAKVDGTHDIDELWQINENSTGTPAGWQDAEEHDIVYNTNDMAPGDSVEWDFALKLSSEADAGKTMYFHVTDNESDGVDCKILTTQGDPNSEVTSSAFTVGQEQTFYFYIETDVYTPENDYTVTVSFEAT